MDNSLSPHNISRLSNDNYQIWKHQMRLTLKAKRVWSAIESPRPSEVSDTDEEDDVTTTASKRKQRKEIQTYDEKSAVAASIILNCLEPTQAQQVLNLDEAKDIWNKSKEIHEGKASSRKIDLRLELSTIKMKEREDINHYLARGEFLKNQSAQYDAEIGKEEFIGLLLNGLPRSFNAVRIQMKTNGIEKLSLEEWNGTEGTRRRVKFD